ncbi:MAG: HxsD-like protein [Candidatus Aenigmatarchaeota archaeon]|nr:MAG: HxsD-like protein [Candidatus Aenigmarchaeota archaeon]
MRNLKVNRKRAELELNSDFYPESALRKAAKDFGINFRVDIKGGEGKFVVTLEPKLKRISTEEAAYEFMNYVLAEVKKGMVKV